MAIFIVTWFYLLRVVTFAKLFYIYSHLIKTAKKAQGALTRIWSQLRRICAKIRDRGGKFAHITVIPYLYENQYAGVLFSVAPSTAGALQKPQQTACRISSQAR